VTKGLICTQYQQQRSGDSSYALNGEGEINQLINSTGNLEQSLKSIQRMVNIDDQSYYETFKQAYSNNLQPSCAESTGLLELNRIDSIPYQHSTSDEANLHAWPPALDLPSVSAPRESSQYLLSRPDVNSVLASPETVKRRRVVQLFLTELESTNEFPKIFNQGCYRWNGIMKRARGPAPASNELCLKDFAQRALVEQNVFMIAKLAQIVADISDPSTSGRLIDVVNHLIVADDDLLMTMEGLQCAFFQSMLYLDTGKPQYAWYVSQNTTMGYRLLTMFQANHS
jgi:hypothetical protein